VFSDAGLTLANYHTASARRTVEPAPTLCHAVARRRLLSALVTFYATAPTTARTALMHAARGERRQKEEVESMSTVSGSGGNYISDEQIMAWLAKQQDDIYGDLKGSMKLSEDRAKFTDELNNIKAHLHEANDSPGHDFNKVNEELQTFIGTYGSDPDFAELCKGLDDIATHVQSDCNAQTKYAAEMANYQSLFDARSAQESSLRLDPAAFMLAVVSNTLIQVPKKPDEPAVQQYTEAQMKTWDELIGSKTDVSSKNDQLTMIHIQELKATLDQGAQLASTFISSGDKTSSAIINNIA
jgi:hypothetical protein